MTKWKRFSDVNAMTAFVIVGCQKCGGLSVAKIGQKTKMCPYCGTRIRLDKAKRLASANNAREASIILRKLKEKAAEKR
ncbi:DUF1922 domain-containing protein [Candidatus Bathyarchaeota archaeon]|nr:MAG: DUF1922 domain-containing protein [Candidatus Bathyarchaeota archaeon]